MIQSDLVLNRALAVADRGAFIRRRSYAMRN